MNHTVTGAVQCCLFDSFAQDVVPRDVAVPCQLPSLDNNNERFFGVKTALDLAPHVRMSCLHAIIPYV